MANSLWILALTLGYVVGSDASDSCTGGYCFAKVTNQSCCVTTKKYDLIGGLQKRGVTHDECRAFCSSYDWCYGIRITYEGEVAGRRRKRGEHSEKCRLLTPGADITMSGWDHFNKNNWAEASEWKICNSAYGGYNCYKKYAPATNTNTTTSTTTTATTTTTTTPLPPIFCGPDASPMHVEMCSLCNPYNATGCKGDCKWSEAASKCVPIDDIYCGNFIFAPACDMCNNKTADYTSSGCEASMDGECKWTPDNECVPKEYNIFCGNDSNPMNVESCSLCMPYNNTGCKGDCKWSEAASKCVPIDDVYCGNFVFAPACNMCNNKTADHTSSGCEASMDGECKWTPDNECVPKEYNIFCGNDSNPMNVESCSLCMPYNNTGCKGDCKWSEAASKCVPIDDIYCGNFVFAPACNMCNNKTADYTSSGCEASMDGECKWTPDNKCVPKEYNIFCGDDANPMNVDSCSLCMPYNDTGCKGDCQWAKTNSCIPIDHVYCGSLTYAPMCDMCNNLTGIANATGCEADDGDCKWITPDNICAPKDPLGDAIEKICALTDKLSMMEQQVALNTEKAEMNRKRHQNVDISFNKLCPLIDEIFDNGDANAPGGVSYDCCYESFKEDGNAEGKIGQAMMCLTNSFLDALPFPLIQQSPTGSCASSCGALPAEFAGK